AVTVAEAFDKALDITGVIMTKLDGDTRGGATLSIKAVTGKPIKFCGTGEKLEDIEVFHPDRMASRILGMGDVLSLIDKAQEAITQEDAAKLAKKLKDQSFDLNDYLAQFESIQKMGNIKDLVGMLPGMGKLKISEKDIDEREILRFKAIIQSMTPKERSEPKILNYTRKKRIAAGNGTSVQDVNKLVKNFEQTKEMMKRFGKGKKGMRLPF
ncbi:MAG: signal recognition particle protein, partial [Clostridia bacterium]|nr:signal recognition particle protein [Clostridia bacterium]